MEDIFERDKSGEPVFTDEPDYKKIKAVIDRTRRLVAQLNACAPGSEEERKKFFEITGCELDESTCVTTPFYTEFGKNIRLGKRVFINHCCSFMDRGGITIGDGVFIAPFVQLITTNHGLEPSMRRAVINSPIVVEDNVWIGAGAIVLPGVTVGKNAIVGAGALVTKSVLPNTVVAGNPAREIKRVPVSDGGAAVI